MKRGLLLFLLLLIFPSFTFSQTQELGFGLGLGSTRVVDDQGISISDHKNFYSLASTYCLSGKNPHWYFKTGLSFDIRQRSELIAKANDKLYYFRLPIGVDFKVGKDLKLVLGAGMLLSYIIKYDRLDNPPDYVSNPNKFQVDPFLNAGIEIKLTDAARLSIMYQKNRDFSPMYHNSLFSPGGAYYQDYFYGSDSFIKVGVKYNLTTNEPSLW